MVQRQLIAKVNNGEEILHFLYNNQSEWVKGNTIEDLNKNLRKNIKLSKFWNRL